MTEIETPAVPKGVVLRGDEALHLALQCHRNGLPDEAELLYRRVLEVFPESLDALHFLGLLCHQQDRRNEAAEFLGRVVALAPENADGHNNLGNALESLERFEDAAACYRKAIAVNPAHAPAHNNLGVVLMCLQHAPEAIESYRRAIRLAPDSADFHYNLGNALRKSGRIEDAIDAYRQAVALDLNHAGAWQALARMLVEDNRLEQAAELFDQWNKAAPGDPLVRYLKAACLGQDAPERAPDLYVEQVFDEMAGGFDNHLKTLDYRAPDLLAEALGAVLQPQSTLDILDAGCGTGLCGPFLRPYATRLTGVDLSSRMLLKAQARKCYDNLLKAELSEFLERNPSAYDLIVSADTFCYFGRLEPLFKNAAKALRTGGMLAFTLENAGDEPPMCLKPHARYAHSEQYVRGALGCSGLVVLSFRSVVLRTERRLPVSGHLVVAGKNSTA